MKKILRILIPIVIVVVVIAIFATRQEALGLFLRAIQSANLLFVFCALLVLGLRYALYGWAFEAGFHAIGAHIGIKKMMQIVFSITFINDTAPTAGMAGSAYMAGWAAKQGSSVGGAISLVFLDKITFFGSFALIQTAGLILLAINHQLSFLLIAGSCIIYVLAFAFIGALFISHRSPNTFTVLLIRLVKIKNKLRFIFKSETPLDWAEKTAASMQEAANTVIHNPRHVAKMFIRMFFLFVCEFASICFVSLSLGYSVVEGIVAAYVAGFITSMVIVQTVGIIEAILVAMLVAFGCDFGTATAIALIYRGLLFWVPFGIGAICVHRTSKDFLETEAVVQEKIFEIPLPDEIFRKK